MTTQSVAQASVCGCATCEGEGCVTIGRETIGCPTCVPVGQYRGLPAGARVLDAAASAPASHVEVCVKLRPATAEELLEEAIKELEDALAEDGVNRVNHVGT